MIICSCNVISDRDARAAKKPCGAPADRVRDVFQSVGRAPKCGRCIHSIRSALESQCGGSDETSAHEQPEVEACA
jgi:bacterioferritin-associated ferredoxin